MIIYIGSKLECEEKQRSLEDEEEEMDDWEDIVNGQADTDKENLLPEIIRKWKLPKVKVP